MMGNIFTLKKEDNIGIVSFNVPGEAMNTWTEEAISGFCEFLNVLEKEKNLAGCIFISGKPDNFFAGANLKMLEQMNDTDSTKKGLDYFHTAFNKLSEFKIPTLARNQRCLCGRRAGIRPRLHRKNSDGCQEYGYRPAGMQSRPFPRWRRKPASAPAYRIWRHRTYFERHSSSCGQSPGDGNYRLDHNVR